MFLGIGNERSQMRSSLYQSLSWITKSSVLIDDVIIN